jgi:uncharacterized Zn finger protein (UPF0148 family)
MEEDEVIKRMTRLLELGGTMLASHHDCGAPLFRYKGKVVCPVCSFDEVVGNLETASQGEVMGSPAASEGAGAPSIVTTSDVESLDIERVGEGEEFVEIGEEVAGKRGGAGVGHGEVGEDLHVPSKPGESPIRDVLGEGVEELTDRRKAIAGKEITSSDVEIVKDELRKAVLCKLEELSDKIRYEQDLSMLKSQLECIKELLGIIIFLKS